MSTLTHPFAPSDTGLPFEGLVVLVTGNIAGLTRDEVKSAVTTLGGTPAPGISAKVNLIVLGEGAGVSKTAKARMLAIPVLDGDTFAALHANPALLGRESLGYTWDEYDALNPDESEVRVPATADERAHWVARAFTYVDNPDGGPGIRQVRFICACGHHWMRAEFDGDDACPRPAEPVTTPPWDAPAPGPWVPSEYITRLMRNRTPR
jgi:hypothetical protein